MFREFEKIKKVRVPQFSDIKGKSYLSKKDAKCLFQSNVVVSEKMDGANVGIIGTKSGFRLQKRRSLIGESEHKNFNEFVKWSETHKDQLKKIPNGYIFYGEWLYQRNVVYYDNLPDYFLAFAVWDGEEYVKLRRLQKLCFTYDLWWVPILGIGKHARSTVVDEAMLEQSEYSTSETSEGIIVFNHKQQLFGKIVRREYVKDKFSDDSPWSKDNPKVNIVNKKYWHSDESTG